MDKRRYRWAKNADGIYYRSFAFCEDDDCPDEPGSGWTGKYPDTTTGGGLVRGSHFYECATCQRTWTFSSEERERRMARIFAAQKMEAEHRNGWAMYTYGTVGTVRVHGWPFSASVIGYVRDPRLGYALTGIVRVEITERAVSGYSAGSRIDVGTMTFVPSGTPARL